jgi:lincosamide nucleotidyltransferase A/C/D/E
MNTEMSSSAVIELLQLFDQASIQVWLDGGWGVDALIGVQTRPHQDLDIIVSVADVLKVQEILGLRGFAIQRGSPPHSFVLADQSGLEVDVHSVVSDAYGNAIYRMENGEDWTFPAEGFSGRGVVNGTGVRCLSPTTQVLCHASGYVPTEKDLRDMALIQKRFGVDLPPQLRRREG